MTRAVGCRKDDRLILNSIGSIAIGLRARARIRYEDGTWDNLFVDDVTTLGDRTQEIWRGSTTAKQNGTVESVLVAPLTAIKRGQTYVEIGLTDSGSGMRLAALASGYIYDGHGLSLGEFVEPGPGGGEGNIRTVTGTDPAANTEVLETVPANLVWRLLSFSVVLVTDATVANRIPYLLADDGTTADRRWISGAQSTQTASLTRTKIWNQGTDTSATIANAGLPDTDIIDIRDDLPSVLFLSEGYRLRTVTIARQVTDNYAAPIFQVEEWLVF